MKEKGLVGLLKGRIYYIFTTTVLVVEKEWICMRTFPKVQLKVFEGSEVAGKLVEDVERDLGVTFIKLSRGKAARNPKGITIKPGDYICVSGDNKACIDLFNKCTKR